MKVPPPRAPREIVPDLRRGSLPKIGKILTTTDFSNHSRTGVRFAMELARRLKATVEVVFVLEPAARLSAADTTILSVPDADVDALAQKQLEAFAREESKGEIPTGSIVCSGKPFEEISQLAHTLEADLIVLATHGHTGVKHLLLGSTAERIVRHAPCAVLTVPVRTRSGREAKPRPFKLSRILVPIDFSAPGKEALPHAARIAEDFGAEMVLIHVIESLPMDKILGIDPSPEAIAAERARTQSELEKLAAGLRTATTAHVSAIVRVGNPYQEICEAAKSFSADLVVLATRGQSGLPNVVLGSTAERVVRHSPCPVLTVRQAPAKPAAGPRRR